MTETLSVKGITTIIGTSIACMIGSFDLIFQILCILIVADYVTGLMKGAKNEGLSSDIGRRGLNKKAAILIIILLGHQVDRIMGLPSPMIRTACITFYIANEGISIMENLKTLGVPLPEFLIKTLKIWKEESSKGNIKESKKETL